jgi:hypothetical protein
LVSTPQTRDYLLGNWTAKERARRSRDPYGRTRSTDASITVTRRASGLPLRELVAHLEGHPLSSYEDINALIALTDVNEQIGAAVVAFDKAESCLL